MKLLQTEEVKPLSTDLKRGYTRLYSMIVLEDWHFKVSNELWKKETFFHGSSVLRNSARDKFHAICIFVLQIINTANQVK